MYAHTYDGVNGTDCLLGFSAVDAPLELKQKRIHGGQKGNTVALTAETAPCGVASYCRRPGQ